MNMVVEDRALAVNGASAIANNAAVPGLNCAHQNLPYIQVLTVQRERQKLWNLVDRQL